MFRIKVPANSAVVRTGKFGGLKIVTGRSASVLCLPWVHSHAIVAFASKKLELELGGSSSVLTKDQLLVTCQAEVSLNSLRDQAAILQQLRSGAADKKSSQVLDETLRRKCMSGIREIIAAREYADLQGGLSVNDPEQLSRLISQLASQGFSVESLQISNIRPADTSSLDEGNIARINSEVLKNEIEQKEREEARAEEMAVISKNREEKSQQLISEQEKKTEDMLAAIAKESSEIRQAIANENKPEVTQDSGDDDPELDELKEEIAAEAENEKISAENKLAQDEKTTTEQVEKSTDDMLMAYNETDTTEQWQESQAGELEVSEEQQKDLVEAEAKAQKQKLAGEQERREAILKAELEDVQGQEVAAKEDRQKATEQLADVKAELERNREDTSDG